MDCMMTNEKSIAKNRLDIRGFPYISQQIEQKTVLITIKRHLGTYLLKLVSNLVWGLELHGAHARDEETHSKRSHDGLIHADPFG